MNAATSGGCPIDPSYWRRRGRLRCYSSRLARIYCRGNCPWRAVETIETVGRDAIEDAGRGLPDTEVHCISAGAKGLQTVALAFAFPAPWVTESPTKIRRCLLAPASARALEGVVLPATTCPGAGTQEHPAERRGQCPGGGRQAWAAAAGRAKQQDRASRRLPFRWVSVRRLHLGREFIWWPSDAEVEAGAAPVPPPLTPRPGQVECDARWSRHVASAV